MRVRPPVATYRLQLTPSFGFTQAESLLPYLQSLGVGDLYLSPILEARPGSTHGYDVIAHDRVREELGGEVGLTALCTAARSLGMGVVLDVVPNHMYIGEAYNERWLDVLENGPASPYARYFDIDWAPPKPDLAGKVLLPILGQQFGHALEAQTLAVELDAGAFVLRCHAARLPIGPRSWPRLLRPALAPLRAQLGPGHDDVQELESVLATLERMPLRTETARIRVVERQRESSVCRRRIAGLLERQPAAAQAVAAGLGKLNGEPGVPESFDDLEDVIAEQGYRLAHWRVAADEINYRRFFDINDLAAIRVEEPEVMTAVHEVPLRLVQRGLVTGLRIDHIDGLLEPARYLAALDQAARKALAQAPGAGAAAGAAAAEDQGPALWTVVEKILIGDEELATSWQVHGTTGYDFSTQLMAVLLPKGSGRLSDVYRSFVGGTRRFADEAYECKKLIQRVSLSSELTVLARRLDRISEQQRDTRDFTLDTLHEALSEVIACFPVYRSYAGWDDVTAAPADREHVLRAVREAKRRNPAVSASIYDFIASVCLLEDSPRMSAEAWRERRELVLRLQQLTGPVMAKAVEDTAFYRYLPLAALSEVGGHPEPVALSVAAFHRFQARRAERWPLAMSATSTHDSKRSEDVRARLLALAERPGDWEAALGRWSAANAPHKAEVEGERAPDARDEHLLYQTLLGVWPGAALDDAGRAQLGVRVSDYMVKAVREAKVHSSWISPHESYEAALREFCAALLDPVRSTTFTADFGAFARRLSRAGLLNALTQTVIKVASPGVPDVYQGCEALTLTLVDPDNRGAVDFEALGAQTRELLAEAGRGAGLAGRLLAADDERVKLLVSLRALRCRRERPALFTSRAYRALAASGPHAASVLAFERPAAGEAGGGVVALAARFPVSLGGDERPPVGALWRGTSVALGATSATRARDALTGTEVALTVAGRQTLIDLEQAFAELPVALLEFGQ
ncbi:MAG: malto-oligosyltrehalose synthase [Deltaproteobacteria bacterium]|nr:malto-oligosyltrehalose synthase [Deltaproteobacteria bacterium]